MEGQSKYDGLLESQAPFRELSETSERAQERIIDSFLQTHPEYGSIERDVLRAFYRKMGENKEWAEGEARPNTRKFLGIASRDQEV